MTEGPDRFLRLRDETRRLETRYGLDTLDVDARTERWKLVPEEDRKRHDALFEDLARNFAQEHYRLFRSTVLSWSQDPRPRRILGDARFEDLPKGEQRSLLLHACQHLGDEVQTREAKGEKVPDAVLLGIGVVMGWYAAHAPAKIGQKEYAAAGGQLGREPKIDAATQRQIWYWKRNGSSWNDIRTRLSGQGVTVTRQAIQNALEREEKQRDHLQRLLSRPTGPEKRGTHDRQERGNRASDESD